MSGYQHFKHRAAIVAATAFCLLAGAADAITFNLQGPNLQPPFGLPTGSIASPINISAGGIDLTITAYDTSNAVTSFDRLQCCGIGVEGGTGGNNLSAGEAIEFQFSQPVGGISILLLEGGPANGEIDISVDGTFATSLTWVAGGSQYISHSLAGLSGKTFRFDSIFRNSRIAEIQVAPVPLPAMGAAFGMLMGLGALYATRHSRRQS